MASPTCTRGALLTLLFFGIATPVLSQPHDDEGLPGRPLLPSERAKAPHQQNEIAAELGAPQGVASEPDPARLPLEGLDATGEAFSGDLFLREAGARVKVTLEMRYRGAPARTLSGSARTVGPDLIGRFATRHGAIGALERRDSPIMVFQLRRWQTASRLSYRLRVRDADGWQVGTRASGSIRRAAQRIEIDNLRDGEVVPHQLVVLRGSCPNAKSIELTSGAKVSQWPVRDGRFVACALLKKGTQTLRLRASGLRPVNIQLRFAPLRQAHFVRPIYLVPRDDKAMGFQAQPNEANDVAAAHARIRLAALMLQTATAELMAASGRGRSTFRLLRSRTGRVLVQTRSSHMTARFFSMLKGNNTDPSSGVMFDGTYNDLARLPRRAQSKDLVIMAATRYDPARKSISGHAAVGGGQLALFGSGTLHAFPASLDELVARLDDVRSPAELGLFDDSGDRGALWANHATGLGAMLHELGHAFGLDHVDAADGVMNRGFDRINRLFSASEGGSPAGEPRIEWTDTNATVLAESPWFARAPARLRGRAGRRRR